MTSEPTNASPAASEFDLAVELRLHGIVGNAWRAQARDAAPEPCWCCGEPAPIRGEGDPWEGRMDGYCYSCATTRCDTTDSTCAIKATKGDGETWEVYAHRLESRIKRQRDHIKHLTELRAPGDIKARNRIAQLERLLGKKELALAQQHDGLSALKERLADGVPTWREILLNVSGGSLSDPCWCGEDWWEEHDAHADEREHAEWCIEARDAVGIAR